MTAEPWRVGRHFPIHVYEGDEPIATFHRAEDAARAVAAVNGTSGQAVQRVLDLRERVHGLVVAHDIASDANGELFADRLDDLLHAAVAGPQRDHDEEGGQ